MSDPTPKDQERLVVVHAVGCAIYDGSGVCTCTGTLFPVADEDFDG